MFPKAEMRATAADGGEESGKILHRNRNCFTQSMIGLFGMESDFILFFNHGFFTELHRIIKPPAAENLIVFQYFINFRDNPCFSVVENTKKPFLSFQISLLRN